MSKLRIEVLDTQGQPFPWWVVRGGKLQDGSLGGYHPVMGQSTVEVPFNLAKGGGDYIEVHAGESEESKTSYLMVTGVPYNSGRSLWARVTLSPGNKTATWSSIQHGFLSETGGGAGEQDGEQGGALKPAGKKFPWLLVLVGLAAAVFLVPGIRKAVFGIFKKKS